MLTCLRVGRRTMRSVLAYFLEAKNKKCSAPAGTNLKTLLVEIKNPNAYSEIRHAQLPNEPTTTRQTTDIAQCTDWHIIHMT